MLAEKVGPIYYYGYSRAQLNKDQIFECNNSRSLAGETLDVPPISAPVNTVIRDIARDKLPPIAIGDKPLVNTLGPQIRSFESDDGCPYPGFNEASMNYAVDVAPDGEAVEKIEILQVRSDGGTNLIYETPSIDGRSIRASARDIQDPSPGANVVRYMLRATDRRNRTSSQVIESPYWAGTTTLTLGPSFSVTPEGGRFRYRIPFEINHATLAGTVDVTLSLISGSRSNRTDPYGGARLRRISAGGTEDRFSPFGEHIRQPVRGSIVFVAEEGIFPDGRIVYPDYDDAAANPIERWAFNASISLVTPASCSGYPRSIFANLAGDTRGRAPAPDPSPSPETDDEGVWHDVECACEEPYDPEEPLSRTRYFTAVIRACATNPFGARLQCGLVAPRLAPTSTAGRTCIPGSLAALSEVEEESCDPRAGNFLILENNR